MSGPLHPSVLRTAIERRPDAPSCSVITGPSLNGEPPPSNTESALKLTVRSAPKCLNAQAPLID